jgi:hypothetical protein
MNMLDCRSVVVAAGARHHLTWSGGFMPDPADWFVIPVKDGDPRNLLAWMPVCTGVTLRQEPISRSS